MNSSPTVFAALAATLTLSLASAQTAVTFGVPCGSTTLEEIGTAHPGGTLGLRVANLPPTAISNHVLLGLNQLPTPIPLALIGISGGCSLLLDPIITLPVAGPSTDLALPIAPTVLSNFDVHFQSVSLMPSASIAGSSGLTVTVDATPPTVTGISITSGGNGSALILRGTFDRPFQDHCVAVPGGLAIITGGNNGQLTTEIQAIGAAATGPVMVLEGRRDRVLAGTIRPIPGAPRPQNMAVFTGTPLRSTMTASRQNISVRPTPGFRPFGNTTSTASTYTYSFAGGCNAGDCLRVWMRLYENGKCHDVYFTENGSWAGKSVAIPSNMSGALCAQWACEIITASLAPRIPGFTCTVVGDTIELTVNNGTGITGFDGGFWVAPGPC